MSTVIKTRELTRRYGDTAAVDRVSLSIEAGSITGLIGPNGAGKTTLLRALLGLGACDGELEILGMDPRRQRRELQEQVCFIADTAVLPRWMKVSQVLDYAAGVHPRFSREMAEGLLSRTEVREDRRVKQLSKGMTVQLHLALVMAIDARLLVLDEPTLGLDILFRKQFFEQLLNDYYDDERTIIISTHQVEEVENILTDALFMRSGRVVLHESMESLAESFCELHVVGAAVEQAQGYKPISERSILGGKAMIFENADREALATLGELHTPSVSDLFIAKMGAQ
ncbi:MAG: ABC transporter ATP-binding protein [Halieaceae bacterium]|jgi:ABC-2 type transport system ATP-binding protein|nr:ABC transporter ATP-binding protein [Halieaceae bacterium]